MKLFCNCCDGIYNSLDVHFTSSCDNKCKHCVDSVYHGLGLIKPDINKIFDTIVSTKGVDDVLFLGGEPLLFLEDLLKLVKRLKAETGLKVFATTSMPKVCYDKYEIFLDLLDYLDGLNISAQHNDEEIADKIRGTKSLYDRQSFYKGIPETLKKKIRINLNIVKPYLYTKEGIEECLRYYDSLGFGSIKLSEIQHGTEHYISFADIFGIRLKSAYTNGCQRYLDTGEILPGIKTPILLKRSCFLCESSLKASISDGLKMLCKFFIKPKNIYGIVYSNGSIHRGWI